MASTSSVTLEQHTAPTFAPDDSDFLDSDVDHDQDAADREIEQAILAEPHPSEIKRGHRSAATASSAHPNAPKPSHDLIQVSRRLWFTYFPEPAPSPALLNRKNGRLAAPSADAGRYHWFNVDNDLVYLSFFDDWGPLNVAMFYRFCLHVHHLLTSEDQVERLVLYTADASYSKANTALLAALYAMIIDKVTPADAFHPFSQLEFEPFRDAGYGRPDFYLTIQDILYGMQKAITLNLLDLTTFNLDEYEHFEQVQNGDWNWLTPNFIAFASPNDRDYVAALRQSEGRPLRESYLPKPNSAFANTIRHFKDRGVKLVVRLNNPLYDKVAFEEAGIEHLDLYFDDGSNPSDAILYRFIEKADEVVGAGGVVAVHCKAGLGRTGVLIGGYLIWKHGFTASEVIGFMRLMRPGCVVGPQQHFMYENFVEWIRKGARESALKEAHATLAREREALLRAGRLPLSASGRSSLKRPATPDDGDDDGDEGADDSGHAGAAGDESGAGSSDLPVTPRARKDPRLGPAATPAVKPTPCVGQPRKSPSPSRKRIAPATVARLERSHAGGSGGSRPGLQSLGFHQPQFDRVSARSGTPPASSSRSHVNGASGGYDENGHANASSGGGSGDGGGGGGGGGNVLMEAQRLNVQRVQPATSPKAALQTTPTAATTTTTTTTIATATVIASTATSTTPPSSAVQANAGTPSPMAKVQGHERSRSAVVLGVSSDLTPASPSSAGSPKVPVVRASPDIKTRYQLRDAGSRAGTPSSPGGAMARTDAEVLGAEPLSTDKETTAAPKVNADILTARDGARSISAAAAAAAAAGAASPAPAPAVDDTTARLRSRTRTPAADVETAGTRSSSRVVSSSSSGSGSGSSKTNASAAATATRTRQPSGTVPPRPATSIGVRAGAGGATAAGTRSASGRLRDARAALSSHAGDARLRAGSTRAAQDLRRSAKAGEATGPAATRAGTVGHPTSTARTTATAAAAAAGTTTTATAGTSARLSRPSSRLLAPTAASAARAAATLKRSRVISPDLRADGAGGDGGATFASRPTSGASNVGAAAAATTLGLGARSASGNSGRLGRSVRRRRSSMGDADVDVVA
ncbi:uncharacterized protein PSFLO_07550 [Pseudozyma flocculosa]|uniref:protein-tyrosine-phosphatase n=1 Tax=Pseudozyma flocculosa TaxID=84751 RepID=A0A5C3FEH4_9BASI|nr:uncharacterized protein PSFLO_07550 [Pseudozyma flocculosa]